MAKASDSRLADITKKRPSSAPKPGEISDVPKIILDDKKDTSSSSTSLSSSAHAGVITTATTEISGNPRDVKQDASGNNLTATGSPGNVASLHLSVRSSSDIGLPTSSMPNLAVPHLPGADVNASENYLEVFCSPRTFRRSVDLDLNAKEHGHGHFEWVDNLDSSTNCLKVLTSGSRVGSALSLNSEYTARSIGLLSNDSDSDNDLSLTESERMSNKPSQLRRFMSYPEDGVSPELFARPSQSMSDLKTMDNPDVGAEQGCDVVYSVLDAKETQSEKSEPETGAAKPESASGLRLSDACPSSPCNLRQSEIKLRNQKLDTSRDRSRGATPRPTHMLSYKCDTHDSNRDIRIRQWLQDMESHD